MGMDVMGKMPTSEAGEYFRNNVWYWRPLWDYCLDTHPEIAGKVQYGHSNDGDGLDAEDAKALGEALLRDFQSGTVQAAEERFRSEVANLPMVECDLCGATGIRTDAVGVQYGMPTEALPEEAAIVLERTHGTCNGCAGHGTRPSMFTWYSFDVENVREFAHFCIASGGFQIW